MAMTRAGQAVGWKSRGLAKDSEGGGGGGARGGQRGQQCQEGDRSLIGATFSVHQRQQQPGFAATPSSSCFLQPTAFASTMCVCLGSPVVSWMQTC